MLANGNRTIIFCRFYCCSHAASLTVFFLPRLFDLGMISPSRSAAVAAKEHPVASFRQCLSAPPPFSRRGTRHLLIPPSLPPFPIRAFPTTTLVPGMRQVVLVDCSRFLPGSVYLAAFYKLGPLRPPVRRNEGRFAVAEPTALGNRKDTGEDKIDKLFEPLTVDSSTRADFGAGSDMCSSG